MEVAEPLHAKLAIIFITMHVKQTALQTAARITHDVMSQMPQIHVQMANALLHAIRAITPTTTHAKRTAPRTAAHTAISAMS